MNFELRILEGPQAGRRLKVSHTAVTFGRSTAVDVSFPQDSFMSGTHLSVQAVNEGVAVTDLKSTNGTFLNGERVTQAVAIMGDVIKIGNLAMKVVMAHAPVSGKVLSSPIAAHPARPMASPSGATTMIRTLAVETVGGGAAAAPAKPAYTETMLRLLKELPEPLYCLLDADADDLLPSLIAVACEDAGKHHLLEGVPLAPAAKCAPYLLVLPPESTLLPVLVAKGWGKGWASYFTSSAGYHELYQHFRKFLLVQVGGGGDVYFRFYDPKVLRTFLPAANSTERSMFFGPVREWLLEPEMPGTVLRISNAADGLHSVAVSLDDSMK